MITGMFLFFPLPAGVLLYMVIANIFQALQTFLLTREALPENLQSILDDQKLQNSQPAGASAGGGSISGRMPFEPKGGNK
jgi:YidC/Oxa1 family membrane protein insertase